MKIVAGASLIAGAIALDVFSAGAASALSVAIGDTAAAVLTSSTVALAVGSIGASMLLSGVADALHLNNTGQTAIGSHAPFRPWQIVYGRQRVSGTTIDLSLSDGGNGDNRWLWQVDVLAAHAVSGIHAVYLNQQQAFCRTGTNGLTGNLVGSSNTDNGNMDIPGMCLDIHPTDLNFREYSNFYFDGNPRFWMAQYDGTQTEADPFYVANCASTTGGKHWDSTCIVQGMAYSLNRFWSNANWAAGMPNARYDVSGKNNIYDPRTDTSGYSENATLVFADYMCDQRWGMQYTSADFDSDTLIAAANICDETITLTNSQIIFNTEYSTEARYTINGTVSTSQDGGSVTTQMLAAMAGRISYVGGKWFIFPGAFQGVAGPSLTETDLIGAIDWSPTRKSRDLFNEVRAEFTCPSGWDTTYAPGFDVYNTTAQTVEDHFNGQWSTIEIPPMCFNALRDYSSDPYLTQDNGVKYLRNTQYPYTISVATAQRLAKIELLRNRWQGTGTLKLPITYLGVMPNDILTITYPRFGWNAKQLEVQSTHIDVGSPGEDGQISAPSITLGVSEVDASQYAWLATDELELQGGQALSGASALIVPPPTGVTLATGADYAQTAAQSGVFVPGLNVKWTAPADASVISGGKIFIQCAPVGATNIPTVAIVDGNTTSFTITGLNNYANYQVQLFCENSRGIYSDPTTPVDIVVTAGEIAAPTELAGLTAALVQVEMPGGAIYATSTVSLAWTESTDPAVTGNGFIQIWAQVAGNANILVASIPGSATQYSYMAPRPNTYLFSIVAVDVWGNASPATAQVSIAVTTSSVSAWSAQLSADSASVAAAAAQTAADEAQSVLDTITGTSVLTPGEKASIIPDYNALIGAQSANDTQADLVGVSRTAYDAALSALTTYLATLTSPVAWNVTTNTTTINGTTFASKFEVAYAANTALLNAIAAAINSTAAAAYSAALLPNANFEAGNIGWILGTGWTIAQGTALDGTWAAMHTGATTGSPITGPTVPVTQGQVVAASAYINAAAQVGGAPYLTIHFHDASNNLLTSTPANANAVTAGTAGWVQSRIVVPAPANAVSFILQVTTSNKTSGTTYVDTCSLAFQPNSLNEIPDGPTRFAAIETGADKTLNHVLTTSTFVPASPVSGTGTLTLATWDVIANGASDVFNLQAIIGFTTTAQSDINAYAYSDGATEFGFGYIHSLASTSAQSLSFIGSRTGLAAGAHTLSLVVDSSAFMTVARNEVYTILQQISS